MNILIIDDKLQVQGNSAWFVWVQTPDGEPEADWNGGYVYSVPEGVKLAADAGYPVGYWMRLSNKIKMSAEACSHSQQQLDKTN